MITIRHEPSGPYVTRSIIEWNEWITESEAEHRTAFLEEITSWSYPESPDELRGEIERLEKRGGEIEQEYRGEIEALEGKVRRLEEALEEEDPKGALRGEIERLTNNLEALQASNALFNKRWDEATLALKNARARTCTVCGKWSDHDDRGMCRAHGKPIKGLAHLRRKGAA